MHQVEICWQRVVPREHEIRAGDKISSQKFLVEIIDTVGRETKISWLEFDFGKVV